LTTTSAGGALAAALSPSDIAAICRDGGVTASFVRAVSYSSLTPALLQGALAGFANGMGWLPSLSSAERPKAAVAAASVGVALSVAGASEFLALISSAVGASLNAKPVFAICEAIASGALHEVSRGQAATAFATMGAAGGAAFGLPLAVASALALCIGAVCQAHRRPAADASNLV
jgi:hypothetical protein